MKTLRLAFATMFVVVVSAALLLQMSEGALLLSLLPLVVEFLKYERMLRNAAENKKMKTLHLMLAEALKFSIVVAALFIYLMNTVQDKVMAAMLYCVTFMVAQIVGAIVCNYEQRKEKP